MKLFFTYLQKTVAKRFLLCYDVPKRGREHKTLPKNGGIFARKYKNEVRIPVNKAIVTLENVEKRFGSNLVVRKMNIEIGGRVSDPPGPLRLRQDHHPADDCRF